MTGGPNLPPAPPVGTATTAPPATHAAAPVERVDVLRLPDQLLARLIDNARPLILSGTALPAKPDGTIPLRTQLGELLLTSARTLHVLHVSPIVDLGC